MPLPVIPPLDYGMPSSDGFEPLPDSWIDQTVGAAFASAAGRFADHAALSDGGARLTYAELGERVHGLAARLASMLEPGAPVAIALPMDASFPAAMLACLRAGLPYVPIDLSSPDERIVQILTLSGACALVLAGVSRERFAGLSSMPHLVVEETPISRQSPDRATPDDVAYILFTSGSTGQPKGVYQNHRGLLHDVMQYVNSVHLCAADRTSQVYSPTVNGAIRDIYGALLVGAALEIVDLRRAGFGDLERRIRANRVTILHAMPPVLRAFLSGRNRIEPLDGVRLVYLAGDRLFLSDVEACRRHLPQATLYVGIGSTECATIYRQWFIRPDTPVGQDLVPVGFAVPDRHSEIIGADGRTAPAGEVGEIVVTSRHLALGYWRDAERTLQSFKPAGDGSPARQFHTGDLGWIDDEGRLHFVGRKDRQVKIRGYRIEPGEIEAHLLRAPGVRDAAVIASGEDGRTWLTAFVAGGEAQDIRNFLYERVPPHQVPSRIVTLPALPKLPNFKIDHAALRQLAAAGGEPVQDWMAAGGEGDLGLAVAQSWRDLLEAGSYERDETFAEAGGDSLLALKLVLALEERLGLALPAETVGFETRPSHLVTALEARGQRRESGQGPLVLLFPGIWSADIWTGQFADRLRGFSRVELIDYRAAGDEFRNALSVEVLFSHVHQLASTKAPGQMLWILGHSFGAAVAFAMAGRLAQAGHSIALLGLIDGDAVTEGRNPLSPLEALSKWARRQAAHLRGGEFFRKAVVGACTRIAVALCRRGRHGLVRAWLGLLRGDARWEAARAATRILRLAQFGRLIVTPYAGKTILFCSGDPKFQDIRPADLGWTRWCPNLETVTVGGSHVRILSDRDNARLVATLRELARAGQAADASSR